MPECEKKALDSLHHHIPNKPQYAPHLWTVPSYVKRLQMKPGPYDSKLLDKKSTKTIQSIWEQCYTKPVQLVHRCLKKIIKYRESNQRQQRKRRKQKEFY